MASPWKHIDELKRKHEKELEETTTGIEGWGGVSGSLHFTDYGHWACRYIPKGERKHELLTAPTGVELVQRLKVVREAEERKAREKARVPDV